MDCSTPGFPVLHCLLDFLQTHWVDDAIQPSHPLLPPSPPLSAFPSIRVFSNESALHIRWPKYWSFSFSISPSNEYSGLISFRVDWLIFLQSKGLSRVFSNTTVQKHQFFSAQPSLWSKLTSIHDYWNGFPFPSSGTLLTQGSNLSLLHCRQILDQLNHQGRPSFCISVQFSHSVLSDALWPYGLQHARLPCPSPTPGACSNSCPLSWWCHSTISSSFVPFSSSLQSFPASGSFPMSQFSSGGQSIGASASTSVLSVDIQDWFPLGLTGLISLQSKGNVLGRIIKQEFKTGPNFKKPFSRGTLYSHCLKSKST